MVFSSARKNFALHHALHQDGREELLQRDHLRSGFLLSYYVNAESWINYALESRAFSTLTIFKSTELLHKRNLGSSPLKTSCCWWPTSWRTFSTLVSFFLASIFLRDQEHHQRHHPCQLLYCHLIDLLKWNIKINLMSMIFLAWIFKIPILNKISRKKN